MTASSFTETTSAELWARIDASHRRFAALVAAIPPETALADSAWTVRDVVGHLVTVLRRYTDRDVTSNDGLAETPAGVAALNDTELRALGGRSCPELLTDLAAELERVRERFPAETYDLASDFNFHGGVVVDGAAALGNLVGEFLVHGYDVARSVGRPWSVEARDAELIVNCVLQLVPGFVRRDAPGALHLQLRVPGTTRWSIDVADGTGRSRPAHPGDRPDAVLRVSAPLLVLGLYSRLSPVAMGLRGALVVGGRRPWRIARLAALIEQA